MSPSDPRPILGITLGDAAGTGPELITRALSDPEIRAACRPVVIGDAQTLRDALSITHAELTIQAIDAVGDASDNPAVLPVLDLANIDHGRFRRGSIDPMTGQAAYEAIVRAVELARTGEIAAIVTSAINKASLNRAGHHFDGHTGLLAHLCGHPPVTMMLVAGTLRVCHVSTHVSLREAIDRATTERILETIELAAESVKRLGIANPRIAVAGLNPHAGEEGLFGHEDAAQIAPAVAAARERGHDASGPHPGDTVFFRTLQEEFDVAIAMYHDQGHVAAKMLGIWQGVNVTLGLPIIRTSVEHGTDFANAGTGRGDPRSLCRAIELAARMAGTA